MKVAYYFQNKIKTRRNQEGLGKTGRLPGGMVRIWTGRGKRNRILGQEDCGKGVSPSQVPWGSRALLR